MYDYDYTLSTFDFRLSTQGFDRILSGLPASPLRVTGKSNPYG